MIDGSHDNLIKENRVTDSEIGIELVDTHDNDVVENEVSGSEEAGILVEESIGNLIKENEVEGSGEFDLIDGSYPPGPLANTWVDNVYVTRNWP
ncbi:NosD domain-containing protein [Chloroflexota bacterium]